MNNNVVDFRVMGRLMPSRINLQAKLTKRGVLFSWDTTTLSDFIFVIVLCHIIATGCIVISSQLNSIPHIKH